jgi:SAM-dependent methyltransferase
VELDMNLFLHGVARAIAETFPLPGPVLEIGSFQVPGQEGIANLRPLFAGRRYIGVDRRAGPGVDLLADVEALPQADASVGTVIAMNTFEHVKRFWRGFSEIRRVLRPDGALLISCPFFFKIHQFPDDYWRFTPAALELLLEEYPQRIVGWHGAKHRPAHVWALAFGEAAPPIRAMDVERYRRLLGQHARQPLSWSRRLRYRLAGLLCGRGPFAPYLDQEQWETVCRTSHAPCCSPPMRRPVVPSSSSTPRSASSTGTAAASCVAASNP